ncbi:penicillin acylase family protein [Zavarzinella formosa]|uniref:penicillin acylase family protein n=1 Tax=Zavarzinella formosa TaxID=360055 RepID=UPI0002EAE952|nr:penicillin acylase family protein [Zavarzinella formosa]
MNLLRLALRGLLGKRLPATSGELTVPGLDAPVTIRRDKHGIPVITARTDHDAWFALGFCHAQDRPAQLEILLRIGRGALCEIVGPMALPVDRLCRKVGFRRAAEQQVDVVSAEGKLLLKAYTAGINAGYAHGLAKRPHEFVALGTAPTPWEPADVLAYLKLQPWFMSSNWDSELARLRVLLADGPEALLALDPALAEVTGETIPNLGTPSPGSVSMLDRLKEDMAALNGLMPPAGGSNNWVVSPSHSETGRPILCNDPHLGATIPAPWYFATLRTPTLTITGASFVGSPSFPCGHNGHSAWGVTAGLSDNADLFLEQIRQTNGVWEYRQGDSWLPCEVRKETIRVKKAVDVIEEVVATPRGPVISSILKDTPEALSLRAIWLDPAPVNGWLGATKVKSFAEFREAFRHWPGFPMNLVYADIGGATGWQFTGNLPVRSKGHGLLPKPGWEAGTDWKPDRLPYEDLPWVENPSQGFVATANNRPRAEANGAFLGADWLDRYRHDVITEDLAAKPKINLADCGLIQLSVRSIPWRELRETILKVTTTEPAVKTALDILGKWDGNLTADSPAATILQLFMAEAAGRIAKEKAPKSWKWALGEGPAVLNPYNFFGFRRWGHAIKLMKEQPAGWFGGDWPKMIADTLTATIINHQAALGPDLYEWKWGTVRPLTLSHTMMGRGPLRKAFDVGPVPVGGDEHTPNHASAMPLDPLGPVKSLPNLRAIIDVGNWSASRWQLAGGQSGNPFSPHYTDLFEKWQIGEGIAIPFTVEEIETAGVETLTLK